MYKQHDVLVHQLPVKWVGEPIFEQFFENCFSLASEGLDTTHGGHSHDIMRAGQCCWKGRASRESIIAGQRTEIVQVQAKQTKASYKEYLLELASGDDTIAVLEEATDQAERKETTFTSSIRAKSRAALLVQGYRLMSKDTQRTLVLGNGGVVHTFSV